MKFNEDDKSQTFTQFYNDLITVPPSMRQQSAKVDTRQQQVSKFLFESENNNHSDSTQSLHYLLQQKEQQFVSLQKKYLQIKQVKSRQPQGVNFMHGFLDEFILKLKDKVDGSLLNELTAIANSMSQIHRMQQTHLQLCSQRLVLADQLVEQLQQKCLKEQDFNNLRKAVQQLQESLQQATVTELDSNKLYRDLQLIKLKYSKLQNQYDIVQKQNEHTDKQMQQIKHHIQFTNDEALSFKRTLRKEMSQNQFNQRRVFTLEQRLEVLSGSGYKKDKDSLRNIIDEMLKENETNKRKAFQKSQEVAKLEANIQDLKEKNQKLNKRIALLEKQLRVMGYTSYDLNGALSKQMIEIREDIEESDIFRKAAIPNKLDFKLDNLRQKSRMLVQDLIDSGTKQALENLIQLEQQEQLEQIIVYMDLFVQYKSLAEEVNILFNLLKEYLSLESVEQLMSQLHTSSSQLNCECIMLWLIDQQTSTFYTYNNKNELINAYIDSDEFLNLVREMEPIYKQQVFVYRFQNYTRFAKDCYLVPLLNDGKLIGLVSMENINQKKQDAKYIGLILSQLLLQIVDRMVNFKLINYQLKYKNILFDSFMVLANCKNKYQFQNVIKEQAEMLFGISNAKFYYHFQGMLVIYNNESNYIQFNTDQGVVGHVAKSGETILVSNIREHHQYHQNMDITSGLPILTIPLEFGILQIVLNQSAQIFNKGNSFVEVRKLLAPRETMQSMAKMFSQICSYAYRLIE